MTIDTITIYTDGACVGNGSVDAVATWAFICIENGKHEAGRVYGLQTNNTGELTAILKALEYAYNLGKKVVIYSDSQYAIDSSSKWHPDRKRTKNRSVKNYEIIKRIWVFNEEVKAEFRWVKGHNNNPYNEIADELAATLASKLASTLARSKNKFWH